MTRDELEAHYKQFGRAAWPDIVDAYPSLSRELRESRAALDKINAIRNSIVGLQTINWSEHIYPLVAALNEAGVEGMPYPEAREHFGTMLERTLEAEKKLERLRERVGELEGMSMCAPCFRANKAVLEKEK